MQKARNFTIIIFMLSFFTLGLLQLIIFRQYAFEASYLYAKEMLGLASLESEKRLGQICFSLGRNLCARQMYTHVLELNPGSLDSMANLAMVLTKSEQTEEALPYYQAYIAGGGASQSVIRAYAHALTLAGAAEKAIPWFYRALSNNLHDRELAAELLATLKKAGRADEALSLREQMSELKHYSAVSINPDEDTRAPASVDEDSRAPKKSNEFYFPSVDGRVFYLPFHFREDKSEFIVADPDRKTSVINEVDLARWGLAPRVNGSNRVSIKELKIGQLTIRNVEMAICDECKTVIGADILAKAAGRVDTRNKIALLILTDEDLH